MENLFWMHQIYSALKDHVQNDLDPDQDHLLEIDHRSRSDPDLTQKSDLPDHDLDRDLSIA